jgi:hypothetical protein
VLLLLLQLAHVSVAALVSLQQSTLRNCGCRKVVLQLATPLAPL